MSRKKNNQSSYVFLFVLGAVIAGVVYIYNSEAFERVMPRVAIDKKIYWNLNKPIKIGIEDQSGIRSYRVVLISKSEEKVLSAQTFEVPMQHQKVELDIEYPKVGGTLTYSDASLYVEVTDGSKWNFLKGNTLVTKSDVVIDQRKPIVTTVGNSFGIYRGGSALVIFQAKDDNLDKLYIETNFGKKFIPQPFYKNGYYISLIAWPILADSFRATVFAEDKAGNISRAAVAIHAREKSYRTSKIYLTQKFLDGKISELASVLDKTQGVEDKVAQFTMINEDIRNDNENIIHKVTSVVPRETVSNFSLLPFYPLENAKAVATYGDKRYYYYKNRQVSTSYHMGIDLASVQGAAIKTRNKGEVVFAQPNGIYGNLPIVHHGLGLYTIYGHCSSFAVSEHDVVKNDSTLAYTGTTGLALGDHLHFGVLVQGIEVRPAEWMDQTWMRQNITDVIKTSKQIIDRSN